MEYLLKKIYTAMNVELNSCELDDYLSQEPQGQGGLTVWQFLDMVNSGRFLRGIEQDAISMAVEEVYQEVIEDVLKQARNPHVLGNKPCPAFHPVPDCCVSWVQGYLWKKGQLRRNWSERWFTLKPSVLSYYMSEDRKEKKGSIALDKHCCVEVWPGPCSAQRQETQETPFRLQEGEPKNMQFHIHEHGRASPVAEGSGDIVGYGG